MVRIVRIDEGGGFESTFDLQTGTELSFTGPGENSTQAEAPNAPVKEPTARFDPTLIYPPEVLAGLNPVAVETVFTDPEKTERVIAIARTREGNQVDEKISEVERRLGPEVVSGLNPNAVARVALDDDKRTAFLGSIDERPAFEEPGILDRISKPVSEALNTAQTEVKQAITIFGILLIAVVGIFLIIALR